MTETMTETKTKTKTKTEINVINVLEQIGYTEVALHSWHDDENGNKNAKHYFVKRIKKQNPKLTKKDINNCIKNQCYECKIFLFHSKQIIHN